MCNFSSSLRTLASWTSVTSQYIAWKPNSQYCNMVHTHTHARTHKVQMNYCLVLNRVCKWMTYCIISDIAVCRICFFDIIVSWKCYRIPKANGIQRHCMRTRWKICFTSRNVTNSFGATLSSDNSFSIIFISPKKNNECSLCRWHMYVM